MEKRTPIRMCISCRKREPQKNLFRFQKRDNKVIRYSGVGRSFYICKDCIKNEDKLFKKAVKILKVDQKSLEVVLKELKSNVKN